MQIEIQIKNFKSIKSTTLKLNSGLNILIGPNGSGKTCICSALTFLNNLLNKGAAQAVAYAGGPNRVYHRGRKQLRFKIVHDYGERIYIRKPVQCYFEWNLGISQTGKDKIANIIDEEFTIFAEYKGSKVKMLNITLNRPKGRKEKYRSYICEPHQFGHDFMTFWKDDFENLNKVKIYMHFKKYLRNLLKYQKETPDRPILNQLAYMDFKINDFVLHFRGLSEYNIQPEIARSATEQLPVVAMKPNGEGVSQVIHALEQGDYHTIQSAPYQYFEDAPFYYFGDRRPPPVRRRKGIFYLNEYYFRSRYSHVRRSGRKKALEDIQTELSAGVKPIESVTTAIDQTSGKRYLVFKSANYEFRPEEVSDGTIKWLCILVSIYVPHSPLYILEEPENFLHPWMQQRLVSTMREQAEKSKTIFLLTSHSTTILNATIPNEILVVTTSLKGTEIREMPNKKELENILEESEFRLGDLWVSGAISGVPSYE